MPPFVAFAGVLGGLAVVRWAYKTAIRINQELNTFVGREFEVIAAARTHSQVLFPVAAYQHLFTFGTFKGEIAWSG